MALGLGTAQFGMSYGVSNSRGQIPADEARAILELAALQGVNVLDTAPTYGNCEEVLGRLLPKNHSFRIMTKIHPIKSERITPLDAQTARDTFMKSLEHLKQTQVDSLLVHLVEDLFRPGAELLIGMMQDLKRQKLIQRLGISVYSEEQVSRCLTLFRPDVIQVPLNVLDQRLLLTGQLARLHAAGIEVLARSVFLQGLLLMDTEKMKPHFAPAIGTIRRLRDTFSQAGVTPIAGALNFLKAQKEVGTTIVGVSGLDEFRQILTAWQADFNAPMDWSVFAIQDEQILNPSRWPVSA
jgi:aryl-alcohol dehydrogenase-like predicted oxidoreductase